MIALFSLTFQISRLASHRAEARNEFLEWRKREREAEEGAV
jgi:hypothetical protein